MSQRLLREGKRIVLDSLRKGKSMLEMLVSSKIRRTLLRHLLTHPSRRFYLSGLARELNLTISPLRRELKRFEGLGLLKSLKEANT
ncbi:MAG: hypothetical protein HYZ89_04265, partial [Candidatus Omnitrophica bacterium]|nr:hypothetical protein [Candidatus Omnitrophota bacterium]